ncbi:nucleotidyltransferase domain-containing protein [Radiobacillus kanasensis]|uniref:nucleotidyltransferase family protein n=1 Tax=Radiobacillus kanasensis TaxID=2844358 RepID=UPI001E35CDE2|nr:nucleotidyltransferase domain-containing protein [Radiobacillus kanasensis]UFT99845.1 nucleotidyltransferase domain-containing protein [Radiobacillus kanasensis]
MYGIQDTVYKKLINYFRREANIKRVTLFGSRAKNTARINSDIDLCITYSGIAKASVQEDIDELVGIYSCDIVFTDQINRELNKQIERDGIVIYKKES